MKRWILLNPGPVNVTPRVRSALLGPDLCHREKEFSDLLLRVRKKLLRIFGVSKTHTVAIFTGSGTAALEAMLCSFADKEKKILVLSNGVYGNRIRHILEVHDTPVRVLSSEAGGFPSADKIEAALKQDRSIHGIALVHHETSTGMLNPVSEVLKIAEKHRKTILLDAVSSLGAEPLDLKKIGLCAGTAGKCLHGFPGLSFVFISAKEAKRLRSKRPKSLYLDLWNTLQHEEKEDTPFTPAVQLFYAFDEALNELEKETLQKRIRSYAAKSRMLEEGFSSLGLRFLIEEESRSHVLTALWLPEKISYAVLHGALKKEGFVIYAGQSRLASKIFRISNLGDLSYKDIRRFLRVLKSVLKK